MLTLISSLFSAVIFSLLGVLIFGASFWIVDRFTPYSLWKELVEKSNIAIAILTASIAISIGLIVASAIH